MKAVKATLNIYIFLQAGDLKLLFICNFFLYIYIVQNVQNDHKFLKTEIRVSFLKALELNRQQQSFKFIQLTVVQFRFRCQMLDNSDQPKNHQRPRDQTLISCFLKFFNFLNYCFQTCLYSFSWVEIVLVLIALVI